MLQALLLMVVAATADEPAAFDGYALGMTIAEAEAVPPGRNSFECSKLMTSRCIIYERRFGEINARVTVHFALEGRHIDQIEIVPKHSRGYGGTSCEAAWSGLVSVLTRAFGQPQAREGNTMRWRNRAMTLTATVLQEADEFCDVAASLTSAPNP